MYYWVMSDELCEQKRHKLFIFSHADLTTSLAVVGFPSAKGAWVLFLLLHL